MQSIGFCLKQILALVFSTRPFKRATAFVTATLPFALLLAVPVLSQAQVTFTEYPVSSSIGSSLSGITAGPDGNLWVLDGNGVSIWKVTSAGAIAGEFTIPHPGIAVQNIIGGPDGNLWFTEYFAHSIGRLTPDGAIAEFPLPAGFGGVISDTFAQGITMGPDGNLWFAVYFANLIGRVTPSGNVTEFLVPSGFTYGAFRITAGPDGNVWFTECRCSAGARGPTNIGRITPAGVITEFPLPIDGSGPYEIAAGPDGNLWFTELVGNKIGKITTTGVITEYPIPTSGAGALSITAGPDGNLWFTENFGNKLGRITLDGVITEFPVSVGSGNPGEMTKGPDGNLWFADGNSIVRAVVPNTPRQPSVSPTAGGNTGNVTVRILGSGFLTGTSVTLKGLGPDITGTGTQLVSSFVLNTTFALAGAEPGIRDVVVTNPDGTSATLPKAFTVQSGGAPNVAVDLVGLPQLRAGKPQTYFVVVTNQGTVDATGVRIWVALPPYIKWSVPGQPPDAAGQTNGAEYIAFDTQMPANSSTIIPLVLTGPDDPAFAHQRFQYQVWRQLR